MELMQASRQWSSRPADERFTSMTEMLEHFNGMRINSRSVVVPSKRLSVEPQEDREGAASCCAEVFSRDVEEEPPPAAPAFPYT